MARLTKEDWKKLCQRIDAAKPSTEPEQVMVKGPELTEEAAQLMRESAERYAAEYHLVWVSSRSRYYHFYLEGNKLCDNTWPDGFNHLAQYPPKKILRCADCERLNEKRKRELRKTARTWKFTRRGLHEFQQLDFTARCQHVVESLKRDGKNPDEWNIWGHEVEGYNLTVERSL